MSQPAEKVSEMRNVLSQVIAITIKNILLMAYGMTIGYTTILIPGLSTREDAQDITLDNEGLSWIAAIGYMCVPIGCFFSGPITQLLGRRRTMQIVSVPLLISWIIVAFSYETWQIYLALSVMGLSGGLLEAPVLTYVAEVTQPHLRGLLGATSTMFVVLGVLVEFFLGAFFYWRKVALYSCAAPAAAFVLLFFIPESPHWLIMKNEHKQARKSLAWVRGWTTVTAIEPEFQEICTVRQTEEDLQTGVIENYTKKQFLHPLVFVGFVFFLAHFSGVTALSTYAVKIFESLRVPMDKYYATILLGFAQFLGCLSCVTFVHLLGKRCLTFFTMAIAVVCLTATATYAYLMDVKNFESSEIKDAGTYKWIPLVCLVLGAFTIQSGIRTAPWILIGEVFPKETRAFGAGALAGIGYIFGFCINKIFLSVVSLITLPGTFWFFAGINLLGVIILYFWLPETEGKTLFEITEHYAGRKKLDNRVRRKTDGESQTRSASLESRSKC